jgi:Fic family protein
MKNEIGFTYDPDVLTNLISRLSQIPDRARALFFAEKMRVDYVHSAAVLEGNPFTLPEVKTLIEGITVGGHKQSDADQVRRINDALTYLIARVRDGSFEVNQAQFCSVQSMVAANEALEWGRFRSGVVTIAGTSFIPPPAGRLAHEFEKGDIYLSRVMPPISRALLLFLWASLNQFFYDGNKRTARLMASGVLLEAGLPLLQIDAASQLQYNVELIKFYSTQDADSALLWLIGRYAEQLKIQGFINLSPPPA